MPFATADMVRQLQSAPPMLDLANTIVVGTPRAGTTSLFSYLAQHPDVGASMRKETNYFRGVRYGRPQPPLEQYRQQFAHCRAKPVRIEATPVYFYGGHTILDAIEATLGPRVKFLVVLREPVSRTVSFFNFMKSRLFLPAELSLREYVERCSRMSDDDVEDPGQAPWFGLAGSTYANYLQPWLDRAGDRMRVIFFDDLKRRPRAILRDVFEFVGVDPDFAGRVEMAVENRTMGYRNGTLQRLALWANEVGNPLWRRNGALTAFRRNARDLYYHVNGKPAGRDPNRAARAALEAHFRPANARLAAQLRDASYARLPGWLDASASR
jgi:hypothetical protein